MRDSVWPRPDASTVTALFLAGCLCLAACSRQHYRQRADREVYSILNASTVGTPWELPADFSIEPRPTSRLHDPGDPDFPTLPHPGPFLDDYELPVLSSALITTRLRPAAEEPPGREAEYGQAVAGLPIQPIPESYWDAVPRQCLARMLEFESVGDEYRRQYDDDPPEELLDPSRRLSLQDIVELALLNSREYQSQKEQLYRASLALTLERFDYAPKFTDGANGTDFAYTQTRVDGSSEGAMSIGPSVQMDKMLSTGGRLLARFANNVVLTFDGPEGFSREVSSELLFDLTHSVFQTDIRLNPLIQAERDLVYAARGFARFRRQFFFQLASQYYGLLRTYRNIEIESQNYFSLVRTFEQAEAEVRAGVQNAPNPVAVDQFEQGMLSGRSSLISTCNRLEQSLDSLKILMGLPTETPINIDLTELEQLTLRDAIEVAAERVRRWLNRVRYRRNQPQPQRGEILNADIFLIERLLEWLRLRRRVEAETRDAASLEELLDRLRVDQARVTVGRDRRELETTQDPTAPSPVILVYQRTSDLVETLILLAERQIRLARRIHGDAEGISTADADLAEVKERLEALRNRLAEILRDPRQEGLGALLSDANQLRQRLEGIVASLDGLIGVSGDEPAQEALRRTLEQTDGLIELTEALLESAELGLPPIDIDIDDAMATALVQRFDLMNERGRLADDRRNIKLTADDLKSVLDLNASHSIRTRDTGDKNAFDFTAENSQLRLAFAFDLPLQRQAQRNAYRRALIDYHAGRRSLMALEDDIKFDIRDGLRNLEETRIQYPISVTQAALAAEQVISVRLQLALGVQGVRGTDLLDALQSSREALIGVANARIGYIIDRAEFVFDLELMRLDETGAWPEINDSRYQPAPDLVYPAGAGPTYGSIPAYLWVSREITRMVEYPLPGVQAEPETGAVATAPGAAGRPAVAPAGETGEGSGPRQAAKPLTPVGGGNLPGGG